MHLQDGITSIGDYAFFNCISLKELTIPGSVTEFGTKAVGIMEIREYTSPDKSGFIIKGYQIVPGFKIKGKAGSKAEVYQYTPYREEKRMASVTTLGLGKTMEKKLHAWTFIRLRS